MPNGNNWIFNRNRTVFINYYSVIRTLLITLRPIMDSYEIALNAVKVYAQTHPRPPMVNLSQAAEMLGISRPTLRKLLREGKIKTNSLGFIPTVEIDRVLMPK